MTNQTFPSPSRSLTAALAAATAALIFLVPAGRSDSATVSWAAPTPADLAVFNVDVGRPVSFSLSAATDVPGAIVHIAPAQALPRGVSFNSSDGISARALFTWRPETPGKYTIKFVASLAGTTAAS